MNKPGKILVVTSGGDAPGMNAAIRAVVRTAIFYGIEVYGCKLGYRGIIAQDIMHLDERSVANCIQRGGTLLQSDRYLGFHQPDVRQQAIEILRQRHIDALVVLGGDGSFRGASLLSHEGGFQVIGIPCTIDNDIHGTDYTVGFDTARNTALEAIDRIRDTAFSHNRDFLVEVMGRSSGFLAVDVGLAGGAEFILLPEFPIKIDTLVQRIKARHRDKLGSIIVIAEADEPGRSIKIAKELKQKTGADYKVCILGHTQRGGTPSLMDRKVASLMGSKAVELLCQGQTNHMLAMQQGKLVNTIFPDIAIGSRKFDDLELLKVNTRLCNSQHSNIDET